MHDMSELQKDVDRIDGILATSSTLMSGPDVKGFLSRWKQLHSTVEYSLTKPFKTSIDVYPHDLPRELAEKRSLIDQVESQAELMNLKDEIIYRLVHEKNRAHTEQLEALEKNVSSEFATWADLTDK